MDQKLLFLINREWISPTLDRLMAAMSSASLWMLPLLCACLLLLWRGGFKGRSFICIALIAFAINDGLVGRTIKKTVARLRPHQSEVGVRMLDLKSPVWVGIFAPVKEKISLGSGRLDPATEGRSFPSNHASNTAAAATVATALWRLGWLAFAPALLVAYSRIYVGSHWPSDVAAAIGIGVAVGAFTLIAAECCWRRYAHRLLPDIARKNLSLLSK